MARHGQRLRLADDGTAARSRTVADGRRIGRGGIDARHGGNGRRIGRGRLAASGLAMALQIARHSARAMEVPKEAAKRLGAILGDSGGTVADWIGSGQRSRTVATSGHGGTARPTAARSRTACHFRTRPTVATSGQRSPDRSRTLPAASMHGTAAHGGDFRPTVADWKRKRPTVATGTRRRLPANGCGIRPKAGRELFPIAMDGRKAVPLANGCADAALIRPCGRLATIATRI